MKNRIWLYSAFIFSTVAITNAQGISKSNLTIVNQSGEKLPPSLHLNGTAIEYPNDINCLDIELISSGILHVINQAGKNRKKWPAVNINVQPNKSYYLIIQKNGVIQLADVTHEADSSCARLNETVNEPFSGMSIDREIRRRNILKAKAQKSLVEINTTVTNSVNEYFNTLKQDHLLDKSVHPKVEMKIVENIAIDGLPAYDLHTSFTYNIIGSSDRIDFELINYRSGKYLLDDSKAALATAMILKETITKYLHQYFEPGSIVKIKIVGTADSLPILSGIKLNHPYNMKNLESYWVTKKHSDTTESKSIATFNTENQLIFSNENLAFLRAFGIHHFIEHEIDHLRATRNEYQHEVLIEDGVGGSYRRVLVEVLVEDIFRNK